MVKRKLLDQVSDVARFRHLSLRTEEAYRNWIKLHLFPRQASPARAGRGSGAGISHAPGGERLGLGFDAEPGLQCVAVSLPPRAQGGAPKYSGCRAGAPREKVAGKRFCTVSFTIWSGSASGDTLGKQTKSRKRA